MSAISEIKNVMLVGAGGNLGPSLLQALIASPQNFNVSVLSRESSSLALSSEIPIKRTDYSHASLVAALREQDAVVVSIARSAFTEQLKLIDAAIEAGVKRFVPSQFGSDTYNESALKRAPLLKANQAVLAYLKEREDKLSWTAVENGAFLDWGLRTGSLGFDVSNMAATLYTPHYYDVAFSSTTLHTIGLAVARSLETKYADKTKNKDIFIRTVSSTQREMLACLEKATGKQWTQNRVNLDESVAEANAKMAQGDFSGVHFIILGMLFDTTTGCNFDATGKVQNELLELPSETIEDVIKAVLASGK